MSRRKLKWIIIFILCIAVLISGFIYYRYVTRPRSIEEQIRDELDIEEGGIAEDIRFFDSRDFGKYRITGFEYGGNRYGVAKINMSQSPEVEEAVTTEGMLPRADFVWKHEFFADGTQIIHTFLCLNEKAGSILWRDVEGEELFTVDHHPAVICVSYEIQDGSCSAEYFLLDKNGEELR